MFKCKVNQDMKSTELPLLRLSGSVKQNPHMRAFWGATCSFFIAFVGWFALAPVALDVIHSIGMCENQLYIVEDEPTRPAFLGYKNIKTGKTFCVHGKTDDGADCAEIPAEEDIDVCQEDAASEECTFAKSNKYDFETINAVKCVCGKGTECKNTIANAGIASVGSTVFVRIILGTMLEVLGPVNVQCMLLTFGGSMVALSSMINGPVMYTVLRFLIGCAGATFVTNQFWCSLMFAPNVIGTANATAAGWGNLGGGVTQIFIIWALVIPMRSMGINDDLSWRLAMLVPAVLFFTVATIVKTCCWDQPTQRRLDVSTYKGAGKKASFMDYCDCLKDPRVVIMIAQYGACFGTELAMNNQLATHFRVYFQMPAGEASLLAGCFGLMNLFARSLGGISSDFMFASFGFRGRLWAHFLSLFFEGIFLFIFGCVSNEYEWYHALMALVCFSVFVQMAEGTSYGIVPFMKKEQLAMVSALVGAGGNAGAVFAGFAFYKQDWGDALTPFKLHAGFVISMAILSPLFYWPEYGSMFTGPSVDATKDTKSEASNEQPLTKVGEMSPSTVKSTAPLAPETARV